MIFKISNTQFSYLRNELESNSSDLFQRLETRKQVGGFTSLEIDEQTATEIRDWAGEKLQKVGFDSNYELTSEGKILEDLIDVFYVE